MKSKYFKEVIEMICMSTHSTKTQIAHAIQVDPSSLTNWLRRGVPAQKKPMVMDRLRKYLFSNLGV